VSGISRLTAAQQTAKAERARTGRIDTAAMSNRLRRALGLMDRRQAAEHEHLASLQHTRLAERSRDIDLGGIWAVRGSDE
jgi:hypothetical protein